MPDPKKVIVVGATGALGQKICKALLAEGADVTAMVRPGSNKSKLEEMGVKTFLAGDMMDKASLRDVLAPGVYDAIIASAAGYTRHSKGDTVKTDTLGYQNLIDTTKEAGIPRFVLISILECDKATTVPHFYNKYLIEQYLAKKEQPYIALRPGAFLEQTPDFILSKITGGILPSFFIGMDYGTIYTPDLARYTAMAALSLPDSELNTTIDVGWSAPVNSNSLARIFSNALNKPVIPKAVLSPFVINVALPVMAIFSSFMKDTLAMLRWVKTGAYVSKNTERQLTLFGELPTPEEGVRRYCRDNGLVA